MYSADEAGNPIPGGSDDEFVVTLSNCADRPISVTLTRSGDNGKFVLFTFVKVTSTQ